MIENNDPIEMCLEDKIGHLSNEQKIEVKFLLIEYEDIFTLSNAKIGRLKMTTFNVDSSGIKPVSVPLRRIPLHKDAIEKQIFDYYEEFGLIN